MALNAIKTLATAALLALAGSATAGTSPFTMLSGASAPDIDVSLTVQASGQSGYDFIINNDSLQGIVTGVYFEQGWNTKLSGAGLSTGPAALSPASLSPSVDDWSGSKVSHTVNQTRSRIRHGRGYRDIYVDDINAGVHAGHSQMFTFTTDTSIVSLDDIMAMIGQPGFGVAIRMQGLGNDAYAADWGLAEPMEVGQPIQGEDNKGPEVTGAPTPTAAFAALAMMGIAGMRRRRG